MSGLDLQQARALFEASRDLTVGIEEEFAVLDPQTLQLVPRFEELKAAAHVDADLAEAIAGELIASEIEIRSGRGEDLADALRRQHDRRAQLFALADSLGIALGATGTHPLSDYREQLIIDTPHYHRVEDGLRYVAWRNNTFSIHVHVGVQGADRVIRVGDRLRPVLPLLLALSANSPYVDGRDSGLHSARTQTFTKSFPRCGVPDAFGSWRTWAEYVEMLVRTNSIVEFTQLWWSIRPHHAFGTLEVRICDVQTTGTEADALATLIVACVAQACADEDEGRPLPDIPPRLIEENLWRAIRYGQDGQMLDLADGVLDRIMEFPSAAIGDRLLEWTAPARAAQGLAEPALPELNGAQRQRKLIDSGASAAEVYAACVAETRVTYTEREVLG